MNGVPAVLGTTFERAHHTKLSEGGAVQQRDPSAETQSKSQDDGNAAIPAGSRFHAPLLLLCLLGLGVTLWLASRFNFSSAVTATPAATPPPPQVSVAKPVVRDVLEWQEYTGRFAASDQVDIRSRIAGYIEAVHFKDGALVKKGDLLFTIDQRPAKFALEQAMAAMKNAQSRIDFADRDVARGDQLSKNGNLSPQIADQRRRDMNVAHADMQSAQAAAGRARLDIEYAEIKAPFAGRVSRRNISIGNLVKVDDSVLTSIVAVDPIYFYFDVDERSVLQDMRLPKGSAGTPPKPREVQIALADEPVAKLSGKLDFVDNRLDEATGSLRMRAVVANAGGALQPGLFGRIRIPAEKARRGILIPDEAIGSDQDRRLVYVVADDGSAKPTIITLGSRIDGYRVVLGGLTGEETIIVNGLLRVRPGVKVTPRMTTLPPVGGQPAAGQPVPGQPAQQPAPKG